MKERKTLSTNQLSLKVLVILIGVGLTTTLMVMCSSTLKENKNTEQSFKRLILQSELNEISGLQYIDTSTLCAIQDEKGKIYFLQIKTGKIDSSIHFHKDGDYEGIAILDSTFYILKSNGTVYKRKGSEEVKTCNYIGSKGMEFEGLCADEKGQRLLVACKMNKKGKDHIWIYAIKTNKFTYHKNEAYKISRKSSGISDHFRPSGISIYENKIYMLSSASRELLVLSYEGDVEQLIQLDKSVFTQPEGITFDSAGKLYISNEKRDKQASILVFKNADSLIQ